MQKMPSWFNRSAFFAMEIKRITVFALCIFALAIVCFGGIVKSVIGAKNIEYTEDSGAISYTASDYIQDGLVAMWDGIENASWGVHDQNITIWKDLIGTCDIQLTGAQINRDNVFFPYYYGYGVASFPQNYGAIECVLSKEVILSSVSQCNVITIGSTYSGFGICSPRGLLTDTNDLGESPFVYISDKELFSCSLNKNGKQTITMAKNGVVGYDGVMGKGSRYAIGQDCINQQGHPRSSAIWFRSIRIYDRNLTEEEIAYNHMIDKARFNIP